MATNPIASKRPFANANQGSISLDTNDSFSRDVDRAPSGSFSEPRAAAGIVRSFGGTFLSTLFLVVASYFVVVTIVNPRRVFWGRAFPEVMPNSRGLKLDLLQKYNSS